ncbi:MAG: hemerythrin domain-containing protein [Candidatus Sericytochromatia bacterium]
MKRDPSLSELSREHLPALILAYRLRHGRSSNPQQPWPTDPLTQWQQVLPFIRGELARHFLAEERFLVPLQVADPASSARILDEHAAFWQHVDHIEARLREPHAVSELPLMLKALGELLEAHIRFEERVWFEQIQQALPPEQRVKLGAQIAAFLAAD